MLCVSPLTCRRIVRLTFRPAFSANDLTGSNGAPSAEINSSPTVSFAAAAGKPSSTPLTKCLPSIMRVTMPIPV
jgi:hypothetical protein